MQWQSLTQKDAETRLLFGLMVFLIMLRFILGIIYPIFSDACQYMYIAKHPSLLVNPHFNYYPPLLMLVGAAIYPILGEFGLKLIAPFFGAVGILYTYKLGKELFDEKRGLIAAIILGIIPSHIYLSAMPYQDVVVTGLLTAFIYYFYRALTSERGEVKAGILAGLTALSKLTGAIVFPVIALYFIAVSVKDRAFNREVFKKCLIISVIGLLVCIPYYLRTYLLFGMLLGFQVSPPKMKTFALTTNFGDPYFNKEVTQRFAVYRDSTVFDYAKEVYLDLWGIPVGVNVPEIPDIAIPAFTLITVLATLFIIYGMVKGIKTDGRNVEFVHVWFIAWVISILILREQLIWGFRRLLPMAPVIALLAARGFKVDIMKYRKLFYMVLIPFVIVFPATQVAKAWYAHNYFDMYSDALQYIKTLPEDSVILIHDVEQCLYYAEKKCYQISQLKPEYLNITTLKAHNITHVVRFEHYLFYDLSEHVKRIDEMAERGELKLVWGSEYVKIYEVVYGNS
ncbi:hypothetical protein DRP04_13365 [Archaeoglobales archaeon]|nr:MAG: hypothetical protein DRP04_13365 [Archaeoglobales archaeon]